MVTLRFIDSHGAATETYPLNPNGSPGGITRLTTADGRFSVLMPPGALIASRTFVASRRLDALAVAARCSRTPEFGWDSLKGRKHLLGRNVFTGLPG